MFETETSNEDWNKEGGAGGVGRGCGKSLTQGSVKVDWVRVATSANL